jgi:hypothetical protein
MFALLARHPPRLPQHRDRLRRSNRLATTRPHHRSLTNFAMGCLLGVTVGGSHRGIDVEVGDLPGIGQQRRVPGQVRDQAARRPRRAAARARTESCAGTTPTSTAHTRGQTTGPCHRAAADACPRCCPRRRPSPRPTRQPSTPDARPDRSAPSTAHRPGPQTHPLSQRNHRNQARSRHETRLVEAR